MNFLVVVAPPSIYRFTATDRAGTPSTKRSCRGGKGRGDHKRAGPGRGRSTRFGWRELRRGERRRDWRATGGGGSGSGGSYVATTTGLE